MAVRILVAGSGAVADPVSRELFLADLAWVWPWALAQRWDQALTSPVPIFGVLHVAAQHARTARSCARRQNSCRSPV